MNRLFPLFLAIILAIGGEYKITHTSGRSTFCKVDAVTPDGDYVVRRPKKIVGYNGGRIPIIVWNKEQILMSALDISEAKLIRPPKAAEDTSWNRLNTTWIPQSEMEEIQ